METTKLKAQIECMTRIIGECEEIGLTNLANHGKECLKEVEQQLKNKPYEHKRFSDLNMSNN